jgi:hypothetical protein
LERYEVNTLRTVPPTLDWGKSITRAIGREWALKSQLFGAQMAFASLRAILGPKKSLDLLGSMYNRYIISYILQLYFQLIF